MFRKHKSKRIRCNLCWTKHLAVPKDEYIRPLFPFHICVQCVKYIKKSGVFADVLGALPQVPIPSSIQSQEKQNIEPPPSESLIPVPTLPDWKQKEEATITMIRKLIAENKELSYSDIQFIHGISQKTARRIAAQLVSEGVLEEKPRKSGEATMFRARRI